MQKIFLILIVMVGIVITTSCNNTSSDHNKSNGMTNDMKNMKMDSSNMDSAMKMDSSMKMDSTMNKNHQMK